MPVLMVLFGFGMKAIITTTTLFANWIIILNSRAGVMQIDRSLVEMARSFGASPLDAFFKVYFWAVLIVLFALAFSISEFHAYLERRVAYYAAKR